MSWYPPSYSQQNQNRREEKVELRTPDFRAVYTVNPMVDLFLVPALKGLLVGLIFGGFWGIMAAAGNAPFSPFIPFGLFGLVSWGLAFWRFEKAAYGMVERMVKIDLNGNGRIDGTGNAPTLNTVKLTIEKDNMKFDHDYPGTAEQLQELASGVLEGSGFEVDTWAGDGKTYTSPQDYKRVRSIMLARGLIQHRNGATNQAYELTTWGREILGAYTGMKNGTVNSVREAGQ